MKKMKKSKQLNKLRYQKSRHWKSLSYGGDLRKKRTGRGARPLSHKSPLHLVLKAQSACVRTGLRSYKRFFLIQKLLGKYSRKFNIGVEQVSIQHDHIHLLIRTNRRSHYQNFFRVFSGQIAQQFEKEGLLNLNLAPVNRPKDLDIPCTVTDTPPLKKAVVKLWKHRPFSRVVKGYKAYEIVTNYIQLNEHEAMMRIPYQKKRLRGLSAMDWQVLWLRGHYPFKSI